VLTSSGRWGCTLRPLSRSRAAKGDVRRHRNRTRKQHNVSNEGLLNMRTPPLVFAIVALLLASCASMESGRENDSLTVLKQLDEERIQAQLGADAVALDRLYAEDFIGIGPSGTVRAKPQVIEDFTSGHLKFQSITTDDVQWRVYGDTAVETGRSTMDGKDKGKTVPRDNRFTRVWVKRQGRWQLVANHYSLLVVPH
jgi:ketosteroid isomerase-like protein